MATAQTNQARKFLEHYVGTWVNQMTEFPTLTNPTTNKTVVIEQTGWELDQSFIVARTLNMDTGLKSLWTITLDPVDDHIYNWWYLDNSGFFDYWNFRRDDAADMVFAEGSQEMAEAALPSRFAGEATSAETFQPDGN